MPSIISTIGYITEANTIISMNSPDTTVTKGVIACNRPEENVPLFINFVAFNSKDKKNNLLIDSNCVYLLHGKFVYNQSNRAKNHNDENCKEFQVNKWFFKELKK